MWTEIPWSRNLPQLGPKKNYQGFIWPSFFQVLLVKFPVSVKAGQIWRSVQSCDNQPAAPVDEESDQEVSRANSPPAKFIVVVVDQILCQVSPIPFLKTMDLIDGPPISKCYDNLDWQFVAKFVQVGYGLNLLKFYKMTEGLFRLCSAMVLSCRFFSAGVRFDDWLLTKIS